MNLHLENLLREISSINKKYDEIAKITGENFNIFEILGLENNEVRHTKFLVSLLDPKGVHGRGNLFLKLFLKQIKIENFCSDGDNINVRAEESIGNIDDEKETGGRLDIAIIKETEKIYIENKIHAGDGYKQLLRYSKNKPKHLIYLTLDGRTASELSTGEQKIDYIQMSYKEDILEWLKVCRKESADIPMLRETLSQYILLIKKLTGQARSDKMSDELYDVIKKDSNYLSAAFDVANSIDKIRERLLEKEFLPIMKELGEKNELVFFRSEDKKPSDRYAGFYFRKKEWKYCRIGFEFQNSNFNSLFYACWRMAAKDDKTYEYMEDFHEFLKKVGKEKKFKYYNIPKWENKYDTGVSISNPMDDVYYNVGKDFCAKLLDNKGNVKDAFDEKIQILLSITNELEKKYRESL